METRSIARTLCLLSCFIAVPAALAAPVVENFKSGDEVRHPVVLLRGTLDKGTESLAIRNSSAGAAAKDCAAAVDSGKFKALVELKEGDNVLEIRSGRQTKPETLKLRYRPMTTGHHVRLIWLTGKDGDTKFAVPDDSVPQTHVERLSTAALLMQSFTAERMHELGLGRRTFRLEMDKSGKPLVHTVKAPLTGDEYRAITDDQKLWNDIRVFLDQTMPDPGAKNIVLMSFTRKNPATGKMQAHTALGGANLGLFGSASMFCWPESVQGTMAAFTDGRKVDPARVHEDSAYRGTCWAVASTTIGATLHEMGHAFGLPHCKEPRCIMTRGFDGFNRFFTLSEPWPGKEAGKFEAGQEAWFSPVSANYLRWSPWFEMDKQRSSSDSAPELIWDAKDQKLKVKSSAGLRWLGYYQGGDVDGFTAYNDKGVRTLALSLEDIKKANGGKAPDRVVGLDSNGNTADVKVTP